jgi:hypothetical protein
LRQAAAVAAATVVGKQMRMAKVAQVVWQDQRLPVRLEVHLVPVPIIAGSPVALAALVMALAVVAVVVDSSAVAAAASELATVRQAVALEAPTREQLPSMAQEPAKPTPLTPTTADQVREPL